jgi:hypothetical protein
MCSERINPFTLQHLSEYKITLSTQNFISGKYTYRTRSTWCRTFFPKTKEIEQVTHKPIWWFRYVDNTFVIWPHGQEILTISEPSQWNPQQDTVYNGKRRRRWPPSILGH